ncbi:Thioredoxin domain-containing protein 17 [Vanrija pseudolonga]|uniref:Thioredoxin domain-containing protein 17 n=1 Tax=Vanrija pseudolonga TaxID=143232 RepID=A0AAF0YCC6_9TREE|nr:Thioredoxin domain-containing protein 17 [Vanrija pseudolonga]
MPLIESIAPHALKLVGAEAPKFLVFFSSKVDGRLWCGDCRNTEHVVQETFGGADKPKAVLYWVGDKTEWKNPENQARTEWKITNIPTIVRLDESGKEVARIVEDDLLDAAKLKGVLGQ